MRIAFRHDRAGKAIVPHPTTVFRVVRFARPLHAFRQQLVRNVPPRPAGLCVLHALDVLFCRLRAEVIEDHAFRVTLHHIGEASRGHLLQRGLINHGISMWRGTRGYSGAFVKAVIAANLSTSSRRPPLLCNRRAATPRARHPSKSIDWTRCCIPSTDTASHRQEPASLPACWVFGSDIFFSFRINPTPGVDYQATRKYREGHRECSSSSLPASFTTIFHPLHPAISIA